VSGPTAVRTAGRPGRAALALARLLILRPIRTEPVRVLLAIAGVAIGVAVALAIHLANESILTSFRGGLGAVAGRTTLQVTAGEAGFDERLFLAVRGRPGVAEAAPVVQVAVPVAGTPGEVLLVLGVDTLAEAAFRDYRVRAVSRGRDGLALLTEPTAVLVTRRFAGRLGLDVGSRFGVLAPGGPRTLVVRGLLEMEGAAHALDGNVGVMDIAGAQEVFDRVGRLDRIDLLVPADVEGTAARLREHLPPHVRVERPDQRNAQVEAMLASFQLNLRVLGLIALFVALFLVYNTALIGVARRRSEMALLRSLGLGRQGILALVLGEAALIGLVGGVTGLGLGILLATSALGVVTRTVGALYAFVRPGEVTASWPLAVGAVALAVVASLTSALAPAREATRIPPREGLGRGAWGRRRRPALLGGLALACLLLAWALSRVGPIGGVPAFGYGAGAAAILGAAFAASPTTWGASRGLQGLLARAAGAQGLLAALNLGAALRRNAITVAAMMTGIALAVSVSTMIHSFRTTVQVWVDQTIRADLVVSLTGRLFKGVDARLPGATRETVRSLPGVKAVDAFRGMRTDLGRGQFLLASGDLAVLARHGRLLFRQGDSPSVIGEARVRRGVLVSETFADRHGVREGERLALPTPSGVVSFPVVGVYYDYTTEGGVVVLDRPEFVRLWGETTVNSLAVYLEPGADPDAIKRAILRAVPRPDLLVFSNAGLKAHVLRIFDQTFAITYALQAIAVIVAILGVASTLGASVIERRREIGIVRALGFTRGQVARTVGLEAGLLGGLAALLGLGAGMLLSLILTFVINKQSFGWSIQFHVPLARIAGYLLLGVAAAVAASFWPAWQATRTAIGEAVRYE